MAKKLTRAQATKMSKSPGTRSKVPTSQLAPKYQKMRKATAGKAVANAAANDPAALTAPMTPKLLDTNVQAATAQAYAPQEQELADQAKVSDATAASIPSWFSDYRAAQAHATEQTKQAYAGAAAINQNAVNTTSQLSAQDQANNDAAMQADAKTRGATVDPSIAAMASQADAARRSVGDSQTALLGGIGATQTAYRSGQQVVGAGQQLRAQTDESARRRNIGVKRERLAKDKGNYAVTTRQKLIDSEHTKQLENKAFDLNTTKVQIDASQTAAALAERATADQASVAARNLATATSADTAAANRDAQAQRNAATIASREREGHLTRLTRKKTANTIASAGNVSPKERARRNTTIQQLEDQRTKAVNAAVTAVKHGAGPGDIPIIVNKLVGNVPQFILDYAIGAATGKKQGKGKGAAQRYREHLDAVAKGKLTK